MRYETNDKYVDISYRKDVTELVAPNAKRVDCRGCTGLIEWFYPRLIPLLEGGGKKLEDILATGCWECHRWDNCPLHEAYGVYCINDLPQERRSDGAIFVSLFDSRLLPKPGRQEVAAS